MLRSSNYFMDPVSGNGVATVGGRVQSNTWIANLDENFEIIDSSMRMVDFSKAGIKFRRGAEDCRLFWRNGGWWFTAGLREEGIYYPRIGLFRLDDEYRAHLVDVMNDGWLHWVEKNWMAPCETTPNFDYIYGPTSIYKAGVGVVELRKMTPETKGVRGGGPLWSLDDGTYLALIHKAYMEVKEMYNPNTFGKSPKKIRSYTHCFARYDERGVLTHLSPEFIFEHFGIEFGAGLVVSGDDVIVSYGYKDVAAYLGKIKLTEVMEILNDC